MKLLSSCGPSVSTSTFSNNNASSGGAIYIADYGSNGTCSDGDPCQCPPAPGPMLMDVSSVDSALTKKWSCCRAYSSCEPACIKT